jgi:hypothetical protein
VSWDAPRSTRAGDGRARDARDAENFLAELEAVAGRVRRVTESERGRFADGEPAYDTAMMAIIRVHAMSERPEYAKFFEALSLEEADGIRAIRNIAVHRGYVFLDLTVLWDAVVDRLPAVVERLRSAASGSR